MNNMFDTTEVREVLEYLGDLKHYYKVSFLYSSIHRGWKMGQIIFSSVFVNLLVSSQKPKADIML